MSIFSDIVKGVISPITGLIDNLHTSEDEKLQAKTALLAIEGDLVEKVLNYEATAIVERSRVIQAEVTGHSWLQRNWRPIVMLWFAGLVGAHWLGFTPPNLGEAVVLSLLGLVKIGLGGYIVSRGAEKIVPATIAAIKKTSET